MRLILLLGVTCLTAFAEDGTDVVVFEAKKNLSHPSVRIPALLRTQKGTLLTVAEGRDRASPSQGRSPTAA